MAKRFHIQDSKFARYTIAAYGLVLVFVLYNYAVGYESSERHGFSGRNLALLSYAFFLTALGMRDSKLTERVAMGFAGMVVPLLLTESALIVGVDLLATVFSSIWLGKGRSPNLGDVLSLRMYIYEVIYRSVRSFLSFMALVAVALLFSEWSPGLLGTRRISLGVSGVTPLLVAWTLDSLVDRIQQRFRTGRICADDENPTDKGDGIQEDDDAELAKNDEAR